MVKLFVSLNFLVSFYDHLIKIKGNNSTPAKVGNEKVMGDGSATLTKAAVDYIGGKTNHKEQEGQNDSNALVHNQANRKSS